jgi:hypothetical protein
LAAKPFLLQQVFQSCFLLRQAERLWLVAKGETLAFLSAAQRSWVDLLSAAAEGAASWAPMEETQTRRCRSQPQQEQSSHRLLPGAQAALLLAILRAVPSQWKGHRLQKGSQIGPDCSRC